MSVQIGKATFRRVHPDRGWGGPYGQQRRPALWECVDCGRTIHGDDKRPWLALTEHGPSVYRNACADNGHGPCSFCGRQLPRLADGSLRAHPWRQCPGKTEAHRVVPRHGDMATEAPTPRRCA